MKKVTTLVLMLCFILSGALCYANGAARTENKKTNKEGISISVKEKASHGGLDKSNTITPTLDDHILTVVFSENLGQVSVEVATTAGATVECLSVHTPNGLQVYIPNAGDYIVTFTLSNGDEYYGEFTVTD